MGWLWQGVADASPVGMQSQLMARALMHLPTVSWAQLVHSWTQSRATKGSSSDREAAAEGQGPARERAAEGKARAGLGVRRLGWREQQPRGERRH